MRIYVVYKVADRCGSIAPVPISAHVDRDRAVAACPPDNRHRRNGTYGLVRSVELDLTGLQSGQIYALENPV